MSGRDEDCVCVCKNARKIVYWVINNDRDIEIGMVVIAASGGKGSR